MHIPSGPCWWAITWQITDYNIVLFILSEMTVHSLPAACSTAHAQPCPVAQLHMGSFFFYKSLIPPMQLLHGAMRSRPERQDVHAIYPRVARTIYRWIDMRGLLRHTSASVRDSISVMLHWAKSCRHGLSGAGRSV